MKILLALETSGGGSGRNVLDLAQGLAGRGHDVTIVWSPMRAEPSWVGTLNNLSTVKAVPLEMHRSVGVHDWRSRNALARFIKEAGPFDIIHGHSSKAGALIRLLPAALPGARVYTPHAFRTMDPGCSQLMRTVYGSIERVLSRRGGPIIAVASGEAAHAKEIGIKPAKLHTVINGVDPIETQSAKDIREKLGVPLTAQVFGFVGRFSAQKNPALFVKAMKVARASNPNVHALLLGDGDLRQDLEALSGGEGFTFAGWSDARAYLPAFDVLVMTSRYEAMPYTLLEALSAGLPIIATDVGGVAETVTDGVNGRILPVGVSPEDLASGILEASATPERLLAWGAASRERASQYTVSKMVERTEHIYQRALKSA